MVFVDSSFWIALASRRDAHHGEAEELLEACDEALLTSNHVRGETWTWLNRRHGHRSSVAFVDSLGSRRVQVRLVPEELESEALDWLRRHDERAYSFVDATSFALMRSLGIREALAFDGDFGAAGFTELRAFT
ncbi:MAG TPA: PIN domain-containing protein [Gaiellaceae bacterium]|nr:PIN domain-containing protein [Gaiellaceae bacterium]